MNASAISASVTTRLNEIVGAANVASDFAQLAAYEIDRKLPAAAVRPATSEEAAEIVKFAAAENLSLVATGARTKLGIGYTPTRYDLALDMTRLNKVIAYDPGDLTLSVEAGVPLAKLAQVLAEHHQFLPLAVPFEKRTTIGGTIASGVDSPLRQFYGTARDFLLGMEFVTGEGIAAKSGGRVVKNVTGYDIHKLMIGALGTLGVITRVNFKTFPMPLGSRGFVARFPTAESALDMRQRIAQSALTPLTIEILSPRVAELFYSDAASRYERAPMPPNVLSTSEWALSTGYAGNDGALDRIAKDLQRMAERIRRHRIHHPRRKPAARLDAEVRIHPHRARVVARNHDRENERSAHAHERRPSRRKPRSRSQRTALGRHGPRPRHNLFRNPAERTQRRIPPARSQRHQRNPRGLRQTSRPRHNPLGTRRMEAYAPNLGPPAP